jgi:hypothetical protein
MSQMRRDDGDTTDEKRGDHPPHHSLLDLIDATPIVVAREIGRQ